MSAHLNQLDIRTALAQAAKDFHRRGWMAGSAGNLSARQAAGNSFPDSFWISASGLTKGRLNEDDFLRVSVQQGQVLEQGTRHGKPSAETAIHAVIYQLFPDINACFHVHSVDACIVSDGLPTNTKDLRLPALEMLKGLGIGDPSPQVTMPVFENLHDVTAIASNIKERFQAQAPTIPALLIRSHGITVWGESVIDSYNRTELVEFILSYIARQG